MANEFAKSKARNTAAAASLLQVAADKAKAAMKTPAEVNGAALKVAEAENWNRTPGPRS